MVAMFGTSEPFMYAPRGSRRFDIPGAATVTGAMLLLVYTVVSAQQVGWGSARTVGSPKSQRSWSVEGCKPAVDAANEAAFDVVRIDENTGRHSQ